MLVCLVLQFTVHGIPILSSMQCSAHSVVCCTQYWSSRCYPSPVTDVSPRGKTKHLTTTFTNIRPTNCHQAHTSQSLPPGLPWEGWNVSLEGWSSWSPTLGKCQVGSREWYLAPGPSLTEVWAGLDRNVRIGGKASDTDTPASLSYRQEMSSFQSPNI